MHTHAGASEPVFATHYDQRAHFHSDWHRRNIRRKAHGRAALTEAEFEQSVHSDGDTSSISASDSDSETEEAAPTLHRMSELQFVSGKMLHLSSPG